MEESNQTDNSIVEGYSFLNEEDAKRAAGERKRISYIEERLDYSKPESVLAIYRKAIKERVFKTPIGLRYLKNMQEFLLGQPQISDEDVPPIPLQLSFDNVLREQTSPAHVRIQPAAKKVEKSPILPISIILNIALVIAVVAMFAITLNSEQPNVLNYEKALVNRYAGWEQELTEREQAVREKERQLLIDEEK